MIGDAYLAQVEYFHACIVEGVECRTPAEQARLDLEAEVTWRGGM